MLAALATGALLASCGGSSDSATETAPAAAQGREGGERGVLEFGAAASPEQRQQIVAAKESYFRTLGQRDLEGACEALAAGARDSLAALTGGEDGGCTEAIKRLLSPEAFAVAKHAAGGQVSRVRVDGDQAFVIYRAPGAKLFVLPMAREGDEWRPTSVLGSVLVPDLS